MYIYTAPTNIIVTLEMHSLISQNAVFYLNDASSPSRELDFKHERFKNCKCCLLLDNNVSNNRYHGCYVHDSIMGTCRIN